MGLPSLGFGMIFISLVFLYKVVVRVEVKPVRPIEIGRSRKIG